MQTTSKHVFFSTSFCCGHCLCGKDRQKSCHFSITWSQALVKMLGWFDSNTCNIPKNTRNLGNFNSCSKWKSHHTHSLITNDFILHTSAVLFFVSVQGRRSLLRPKDEGRIGRVETETLLRFGILSRLDILLGLSLFSAAMLWWLRVLITALVRKCRKKTISKNHMATSILPLDFPTRTSCILGTWQSANVRSHQPEQ